MALEPILSSIIIILIGIIGWFLRGKFKFFVKTIESIKHNLKVIADTLIESPHIDFDHRRLQDYSPLKLTQEGQQYLEKTGFVEIYQSTLTGPF